MNKKLNKFKDVKSYKSLYDKEKKQNYLEVLSLEIIYTINEIKSSDSEYKKYVYKIPKNCQSILNSAFNEIKTLLWIRFCVQIRDYLEVINFLLNDSKSKLKYEEVKKYIESTKFISAFVNGTEEYNAISLSLHNLNEYNYGEEKWNEAFEKYISFNKAIVENNMKTIKKEFEIVIEKFRISEEIQCFSLGLDYIELSPIYKLFEFLLQNKVGK